MLELLPPHYVLVICGAWSTPMFWLYVVLGAHLCVGYMYCGVLGAHLCKRGVAFVKFQSLPISYGVTGHICIL